MHPTVRIVKGVLPVFLAILAISAATGISAANEALMDPASLNATAPDIFKVKFETSRGDFVIEVTRAWAPSGADRFYNLVTSGYFDGCRFFRVLPGFVAQFGMHGDPAVTAVWRESRIKDDPVTQSNVRGTITFATSGPDTRTTQLFINYRDNNRLDGMGFSPFGKVIEGMEVVDGLYGEYGEGAPQGRGPSQAMIAKEGNAYLEKDFPKLDFIKKTTVLK